MDRRLVHARAAHADDVETAEDARIAVQHAIGDDIVGNGRQPADEGLTADAGELVHGRAAAKDDAILDDHMAGEHHVVRHDDVVAEDAVVRDVRIGKEQVVVADDRLAAAPGRAGIGRHALAEGAFLADRQRGLDAVVMQALRIAADDGVGKDAAAAADDRAARRDRMRQKLHLIVENDLGPDIAEGTDDHVLPDDRPVFDDGERMDLRTGGNHDQASSFLTIIAPISASATRCPSTFASQ